MSKGILGRKIGMTQIYDESGAAVPVTVIEAGPCPVLQVRTADRDGYEAVQLGFQEKKRPTGRRSRKSQASRAERGHVSAKLESKRSKARQAAGVEIPVKAECEPPVYVREFRGPAAHQVGDTVTVAVFEGVAAVDVIGTSKGRGFSGGIKRHGFGGLRATHGVKKSHRSLGGTGMSATPSRVMKGKRMPGQYGNERVTTRNLAVVRIDGENNLILVRGGVPGPKYGFVMIRETNKLG